MNKVKYNDIIFDSFESLRGYCEGEDFKGWDPYDGLNSELFQMTPLRKFSLARLAVIQLFKRNPVNLRKFALVKKDYNPKGLGLFLTGYCNLYKVEPRIDYMQNIEFLSETIISLISKGYSGACWGYNFDWQNRAFFLPKGTPTVVATSFIAYSLLDAYDVTGNEVYLKTAISATDFILNDLNRTKKGDGFIFSYSPFDNTVVYNASLLGSRLLSRVYGYTKNEKLIEEARRSVLAVVNAQRPDGSWIYGEHKVQGWVDSFHTGYNLECIYEYQKYSMDDSFLKNIQNGLNFYLNNFFLSDGTPKYYHNKVYPIDIHAPAQFVVTLSRLDNLTKHLDLTHSVLIWTIRNMQNSEKGFFYYQLKKGIFTKIPYMRWAQAWMFYALSFYTLNNFKTGK